MTQGRARGGRLKHLVSCAAHGRMNELLVWGSRRLPQCGPERTTGGGRPGEELLLRVQAARS